MEIKCCTILTTFSIAKWRWSWQQLGKRYNQTDELVETIFEILGREAENADSLEGFTLCHSISGGTGSGLGSKILEQIKERYPKTILQTYSVFASPEQSSDVVVGPYNSVLALEWLVEHPDLIVVLDNQALYRLATDTMRVQTPTHAHINAMVSKIMTSLTAR
uniref:Tubulin/FtsZ GTPase domain-containing protein n=1 Tax=Ditylenchus dipsaci TaxID=166011 RepID=A0A915DUU9_9BILA